MLMALDKVGNVSPRGHEDMDKWVILSVASTFVKCQYPLSVGVLLCG